MNSIKGRWWQVNGSKMYACVANGHKAPHQPVIVLVHGLGASHHYMMPLVNQLAPFASVYAVDLPGFGLSEKPPQALSIPQLADALLKWMDTVYLKQPVLVGNSMGCQVIADLAARYPLRAAALVLQGPTTDAAHRTVWQQMWRLILSDWHEPRNGLAWLLLKDYWRCGPIRFAQTARYALEDRIEDKLPHVMIPALVVVGTRDDSVPLPWAKTAAHLLPHGRFVAVPGGTHAMNYSLPDELQRLTLNFLSEVPVA